MVARAVVMNTLQILLPFTSLRRPTYVSANATEDGDPPGTARKVGG